jgi:hypothetical protein
VAGPYVIKSHQDTAPLSRRAMRLLRDVEAARGQERQALARRFLERFGDHATVGDIVLGGWLETESTAVHTWAGSSAAQASSSASSRSSQAGGSLGNGTFGVSSASSAQGTSASAERSSNAGNTGGGVAVFRAAAGGSLARSPDKFYQSLCTNLDALQVVHVDTSDVALVSSATLQPKGCPDTR